MASSGVSNNRCRQNSRQPSSLRNLSMSPDKRRPLGGGKLRGMPDLSRADLAEAQMRRQARGRIDVRAVAVVGIADDALGEECLQPFLRRAFARGPRLAQPAGPIGLGRFERPVLDGFARDAVDRWQQGRCGQQFGGAADRQDPPPERREDPQAPAILAADLGRLDQEIAGKFFRLDADGCQLGFNLRGNRELGHLRDLVPEHRPGAGLARNLRDCRCRRSPSQHQRGPDRFEALAQLAQRLRQPPARGGAERARTHSVCASACGHSRRAHRGIRPARRSCTPRAGQGDRRGEDRHGTRR